MGKKWERSPAAAIIGANAPKESLEQENKQEGNITLVPDIQPITERAKKVEGSRMQTQEAINEKLIAKQIKLTLSTSLRMSRIISELKILDPEGATKYTQKFLIDEAIEKQIKSYESKLGIK